MSQQFEVMSLANLKGGAAIELFDAELRAVIENIKDMNTAPGARSITLKVVLKPNDNRERVDLAMTVSSKLAPFKVQQTSAFICEAPDVGACAIEPDLAQMGLFQKPEPVKVDSDKVVPFRAQG